MVIKLKNKIFLSKSLIIQFLLMFPFMEPAVFREFGTIHKFYMIYKILVAGIIALMYIFGSIRPSKVLILIGLYECVILLSTIINSANIFGAFNNLIAVISVCALIEYYIKKDTISITTIIYYVFAFFTIINIVDVFIESLIFGTVFDGHTFFLGIDNRFVFIFLPMICMGAISIKLRHKNKLALMFLTGIAFLTLFYTWSVAAAMVMGICLLYIKLTNIYKQKLTKFTLTFYLIFIIAFNILIVFMRIQNYFADFIVNVLHKDISLSGRIFLWEIGIEKILQSPLIGYGVNEQNVENILGGLVHFHNYFINMLYQSGAISMIVFILINIIVILKTKSYKDTYIYKINSFLIFISLLLSVFDTLDYTFFYVFYIILYNIDFIEKNECRKYPGENVKLLLKKAYKNIKIIN